MSDLPGCTCAHQVPDHAINGCMLCDCRATRGVNLNEIVTPAMHAPLDWQIANNDPDAFTRGAPVGDSPEIDRILALPRRKQLDLTTEEARWYVQEAQTAFSKHTPDDLMVARDAALEGRRDEACQILGCKCREIDPRRPNCVTELLPIQAYALAEMRAADGMIGAMATGSGKTFVYLLGPLAMTNCELALLLVPPSLISQLAVDYQLLAQHFHVPSVIIHGGPKNSHECKIPGAPTLHVLPFSRLSHRDSSDWIDQLSPDLILVDEVDAFKDRTAARTQRLLRYFREQGPRVAAGECRRTRFVGASGSLINASITDVTHLAVLAFRERSPMPLDPIVAADWARCLDPAPVTCEPGALERFAQPGENIRVAFGRRLAETPGFVVSTSSKVEVTRNGVAVPGLEVESLIRQRRVAEIPDIIKQGLTMVRAWQRPDTLGGSEFNDPIEDPMRRAKIAIEVASGMFYRWIFPRGEPRTLIEQWFAIRRSFFGEVRALALQGRRWLDSVGNCEEAARRFHGDSPPVANRPNWDSLFWPAWRDIRDLVQPTSVAVRLHPYLVEDAAEWAQERPGIIWYAMREYAQWLHEISGLVVHGGGPDAGREIARERGDRPIIASMEAHGRGRDGLQFAFDRQLVVQTPASNGRWQQLLARTERRGQTSQVVTTDLYLHTPEIRQAFRQAQRRGRFVEQILNEMQKLISGWRDEHGVMEDDEVAAD